MSTPVPATTEWVPLWDLTGGVNLDYKGAWAAGTYKDGEVVVHQGITYMCVRQTTKMPTPWYQAAGVASSYGTSLPASPYDGQEAVLVNDVTGPYYHWRFRYNAQSTSEHKWECIGGAAAWMSVDVSESTASTTATDLATVGPQLVLLRTGVYDITIFANMTNAAAGFNVLCLRVGATVYDQCATMGAGLYSEPGTVVRLGGYAGETLKLQYRVTSGTCTFNRRRMSVLPVRVA